MILIIIGTFDSIIIIFIFKKKIGKGGIPTNVIIKITFSIILFLL